MIPPIKYLLNSFQSPLMRELHDSLDELEDVCSLIDRAIMDDPPLVIKDGGIIKEGYNEEIDRLRKAKTEGKQWLSELEAREREKTGIKNLRIKYNKVFGYYLEVTNSYKDLVPDYYMRKQTLTNAERYITPELKELEDVILGAEDKLFSMEYDLFTDVRDTIAKEVLRIQTTARALAAIDVFTSLAFVAEKNDYVRPKMNSRGIIDIKNGRHPVVEKMMQQRPVHCQRHLSGQWKSPRFHHHRPEHGRKVHLHASDGPDCAHGPGGKLCAGRFCEDRHRATGFSPEWEPPTIWPAVRVPLWWK